MTENESLARLSFLFRDGYKIYLIFPDICRIVCTYVVLILHRHV
jgi:hypothetical protein